MHVVFLWLIKLEKQSTTCKLINILVDLGVYTEIAIALMLIDGIKQECLIFVISWKDLLGSEFSFADLSFRVKYRLGMRTKSILFCFTLSTSSFLVNKIEL